MRVLLVLGCLLLATPANSSEEVLLVIWQPMASGGSLEVHAYPSTYSVNTDSMNPRELIAMIQRSNVVVGRGPESNGNLANRLGVAIGSEWLDRGGAVESLKVVIDVKNAASRIKAEHWEIYSENGDPVQALVDVLKECVVKTLDGWRGSPKAVVARWEIKGRPTPAKH